MCHYSLRRPNIKVLPFDRDRQDLGSFLFLTSLILGGIIFWGFAKGGPAMLRITLRSISRFSQGPAVALCHPVSVRTMCYHHARSAWWFMDGFGKEVWKKGNDSPEPNETATNEYSHRPDTVHALSRATVQRLSQRTLSAAVSLHGSRCTSFSGPLLFAAEGPAAAPMAGPSAAAPPAAPSAAAAKT